jgi:hypothetical protein
MNTNRIWIYLSDNPFNQQTKTDLKTAIQNFLLSWNAHGKALSASYEIRHHHFIIIKADEAQYSASGCSIDKQLQFIKELEKKHNLSLLNRLMVAYKNGNEILLTHSSKIPELLTQGLINENTTVFNIALSTEEELNTSFELPLKQTWLSKYQNSATLK